ncbi:hypothetical protein NP233_g3977 [Leucocoprinus birnbaumii]|uniref:Major facilitator superfamily (MFS) profile domain-containing protein n=1 Tax=Leucocoprinus birnbaumii TaxID=56174 RepID=A0AAD5YTE5_9AGAR|nr:hypothetical protein NP233_g3977 [Leucocoprinus birnbaumii]
MDPKKYGNLNLTLLEPFKYLARKMSLTLKERIRSVSLIFACGTALFSDGYSNGIISAVNTILNRIYGADRIEAHNYGTILRSVVFAGTIVGMLSFGWLSDKVGRKFGMMSANAIVALFAGLSAASKGAGGELGGMLSMLIAMRFLLGIGIGAEYPCGSVSASEQSEEPGISKRAQHRWFALATNTMIDFGFVIAAFVPLVLFWIFGDNHLRAVWRLSLGLGVVPALLVFLWRLNMDEPERFKKDSMKHARIPYWLVFKRYWVSLAAISFTWFLYDFIVYPFGLYSSIIVDRVTGGNDSLTVVLGWNVVIKLTGPGHIGAFAVVYGIFLSFGELGPGNCLGLLASKTSPTAVRGQFYGLAAAIGKVGAFVGTWAFPPMIDAFGGSDTDKGNTGPFWVGSGLAILSALVVFFFIRPLTTDGMIEEDEAFRRYLEEHGYDTSAMGLSSATSTAVETIEPEGVEKDKTGSFEKV